MLSDARDGIMRAAGYAVKQSPPDDAQPQESTVVSPKPPLNPGTAVVSASKAIQAAVRVAVPNPKSSDWRL